MLHPTKQKTFEQVLQAMTDKVKLPTGAVRRVFTPLGKPVKQIEGFKENGRYVCCGAEKLNVEQSQNQFSNSQNQRYFCVSLQHWFVG